MVSVRQPATPQDVATIGGRASRLCVPAVGSEVAMVRNVCPRRRLARLGKWLIPCVLLALHSVPLSAATAVSDDPTKDRPGIVSSRTLSRADASPPTETARMDVSPASELPPVLPDAAGVPGQVENGSSIKLSPPLVGGGDVSQVQLSPDGTTVVYLADQELDNLFTLYSVPIDGSATATRINALLTPTCSIDGTACPSGECPPVGACSAGGGYCESDLDCPGMMNVRPM